MIKTNWFTDSSQVLLDKYFGGADMRASANGIYLVAHSDTVFTREPKEDEILKCFGIWTALKTGLGADNRVGLWTVWMMMKEFADCGFIISQDEEKGDITIKNDLLRLDTEITYPKLFISFDRRGMSNYVDYDNYCLKIKNKLADMKIKREYGTYSTVSFLSEYFGIPCVNLCICAENFHSKAEWWDSRAYKRNLYKYKEFIRWAIEQDDFEIEEDPYMPVYNYKNFYNWQQSCYKDNGYLIF